MVRHKWISLVWLMFGAHFNTLLGMPSDTIGLVDDDHVVFVLTVKDYETALKGRLGGRADAYILHIDSLASTSKDSIRYIEKAYWTSLSFYEVDDFEQLENALMDAFVSNKLCIFNHGIGYYSSNCQIKTRKVRRCNSFGKVVGINWEIRDGHTKKAVAELTKVIFWNRRRCGTCF